MPLPKKLKDDSIIEALCHVQFSSAELPEIVLGRLSDLEQWKDYSKESLPVSNIPAPVRRSDPNLKYEPLLGLRSPDGLRLVRIGENSVSYHVVGRYCGWDAFKGELERVMVALFDKLENLVVTRLGFRYVNGLTNDRHLIPGLDALDLTIQVSNEALTGRFNLNYETSMDNTHTVMTRVASPFFVQGGLAPEVQVVVDVDVYTPPGFETVHIDSVLEWVNVAHEFEKEAFFKLLPSDILDKLVEA